MEKLRADDPESWRLLHEGLKRSRIDSELRHERLNASLASLPVKDIPAFLELRRGVVKDVTEILTEAKRSPWPPQKPGHMWTPPLPLSDDAPEADAQ